MKFVTTFLATLLRLYGMAHTVVNCAGMSAPTGEESLSELAFDVTAELIQIAIVLRTWISQIEPLEQLTPRN